MLDKSEFFFKAALTSLFAAATLRLELMGGLLWIFIASVILDYISGMMSAIYNKELNSHIGLRGIIKKVGKCFIIAVALLSDEVVAQSARQLGMGLSTGGAIAATVTIWMILNELISILENLVKIDVAFPAFLLKAMRLLKNQTETAGEQLVPEEPRANHDLPE